MKIACVIPHYNHPKTVLSVAEHARKFLDDVLIIDDGSTLEPENFASAAAALGVHFIRHSRNLGKGAALRTAAAELGKENFDYMIVIDADGQHDPEDLPKFLDILRERENCIVIGCRDFASTTVPRSSRFGRKFSNFWCRLETGISCKDTQSGFRAYPVKIFNKLKLFCSRYNFEIEILVRLLWAGCELREVPISVTYQDRITHFHPWKDNFRLSLLHSVLVFRHILPIPHRKLVLRDENSLWSALRHPGDFFHRMFKEDATPGGLALAAATGTFLAIFPLIGLHTQVILYICIKLRLNKVMALAIQHLFEPPLVPLICVELGYLMRHGRLWTNFTISTCIKELHLRLFEWLLGSLVMAPLCSIISYFVVFSIAKHFCSKSNAPNLSARRGNWLGIGFFKLLLRCGGYRIALFFAWIVTWFYARFDRKAYQAALPYLTLRFPQDGKLKKHFHRLIYHLAKSLIISYRAGMGKGIPIREEGTQFLNPDQGQILVLAHFGCWQSAMQLLGTNGRCANIMARPDKNANLDKYLALGKEKNFKIISTESFAGGILDAADALERKETVIIMGDRAVDNTPSLTVPFFDGEIELPLSPWQLASRCDVPVIPVLVFMQDSPTGLTICYHEPIKVPAAGERKPKLDDMRSGAAAYAQLLESAVKAHPYDFFRFGNEKN